MSLTARFHNTNEKMSPGFTVEHPDGGTVRYNGSSRIATCQKMLEEGESPKTRIRFWSYVPYLGHPEAEAFLVFDGTLRDGAKKPDKELPEWRKKALAKMAAKRAKLSRNRP